MVENAKRRDYLKAGAAIGMAGLSGCLGGSGDSNDGKVQAGVVSSLSSNFGDGFVDAIKIWKDDVNAGNGVIDQEVELTVYDDEGTPSRARELTNRLITQDEVDFIMGPFGSQTCKAVAPLAKQHQIPIGLAASDPEIIVEQAKGYDFTTTGLTTQYGTVMPRAIREVWDWSNYDMAEPQTVAIINANLPFTTPFSRSIKGAFEERDFEIVYDEDFPADINDFSSIISEINQEDPDVLVVVGYPEQEILFANQAKNNDLNIDIQYHSFSVFDAVADTLGPQVNSLMSASWWIEDLGYNRVDKYVEEWYNRNDARPLIDFGQGSSQGMVYEHAINEAGSTNADDLIEAIYNLDVETTMGRTEFHEDGYNKHAYKSETIVQWQSEDLELIVPDEFKTSEPILPLPPWDERGN